MERLAALEDVSDPRTSVPRLIIEYRQLTKLIGTYLGNLAAAIDPATGRIHTTFHQIYTATGRLASSGPNLQNIPVRTDVGRQVRKAFKAPEGSLLICADYSQIELRILAHLSQDEALINAFAAEEDIHAAVASRVFGVPAGEVTRVQRTQAKTINFGIIYGVTAFGLARRIEGLDVASATRLIADYKERFPGIDRFLARCVQEAVDRGYVTTILGRRRAIPEIASGNHRLRAFGERLAINSVVQGSAADLIKLAMVDVARRIDADRLPLKLLLQIHDELVFESPRELAEAHAEIVVAEMERAMVLRVPLRCSAGIGADWGSAKYIDKLLQSAEMGTKLIVKKPVSIQSLAAQIVSEVSDDLSDFATAATLLTQLVRRSLGARACVVYRADHQSGRLLEVGDASFGRLAPGARGRLRAVLARAADVEAADAPEARTVTPDSGVWCFAIRTAAGGGESPAPGPFPPGLLGVWAIAFRETEEEPQVARCRAFHPFFRMLLRQLAWCEEAHFSRRQTEKRLREMGTIHDIGEAMDTVAISGLMQLITQKAAVVMEAQACSLMQLDEDTGQLTIAASSGLPDDVVENTRVFVGNGIAGPGRSDGRAAAH